MHLIHWQKNKSHLDSTLMKNLGSSDVRNALTRLSGISICTPVITSRILNRETGMDVYLKCENFQRAGAFKFRGAYNAISQLTSDQREAGVITPSNGNHAQGVTLAAKLLGVRAIVVMPENAPPIKRAAT
jgi:threonine dehydratase